MKVNHDANNAMLTGKDVLTGLMCLVGMVPGLVCYDRLPDQIPIHWGLDNQPNGWASKPFVVFGLPLLMIVLHLLCCAADGYAGRKGSIPKGAQWVVRLIIPLLTIVVECVTMAYVADLFTDIGMVALVVMSVVMVALGNYLPKTRPNATFGIKVPWTLHNEEVWHKTHRLAGWLMVVGGLVMLVCGLTGQYVIGITVAVGVVLIPMIYSWVISRKQSA